MSGKNRCMKRLYKILSLTFLFTALYATIRYHLFGPVLWKDFFIFTLNKIFIFSAVIFIFFLKGNFLDQPAKIFLKRLIYSLIVLHVIFSTFILKPYYLKSFFTPLHGLSLWGNISLLFGALAAILFLLKESFISNEKLRQKLFIIFVMLHLVAMGWHGWVKPGNWYGGMLPITLVAFLILLTIVLRKKTT